MLAKCVFTLAGVYGIVVLTPLYFLENWLGRSSPPAITHPEFFYGFVGVALAWQFGFLMIGRDPLRFRPWMLPSVLEKITYAVAVIVLFVQGRIAISTLATGSIDLLLAGMFVAAFFATRPPANEKVEPTRTK